MCPACLASAAIVVAQVAGVGGVTAVALAKLRAKTRFKRSARSTQPAAATVGVTP